MSLSQANIDYLIGPTHNFAGLGAGNIASINNADTPSNPKKAAIQGLEKMRLVHEMGALQYILPPHPRPLPLPEQLGLQYYSELPLKILLASYSASYMWAANAATIIAKSDSKHNIAQVIPANLHSNFHRSLEAEYSAKLLKDLLPSQHFQHHPPLIKHPLFADEGAANHCKVGGINILVYGEDSNIQSKFPARQSRLASEAIAKIAAIKKPLLLKQKQDVIDLGVFHNDVIATSHEDLFIYHERAYEHEPEITGAIKVCENDLSVIDAVANYFFNCQMLTMPSGEYAIILPQQCKNHQGVEKILQHLSFHGLSEIRYIDLGESMKNGGGPACLRLRIYLDDEEVNNKYLFDMNKYEILRTFATENYPEEITIKNMQDENFADEMMRIWREIVGLFEGF